MSKRQATSVLTHDNWDQDDPDEDAGTFEVAGKDVLQKRQIRVAKRRIPAGASNGDQPKASTFSGFAGFGLNTDKKASTPSFSFLSNGSNSSAASTATAIAPAASTTGKSISFFSPPASQASVASSSATTAAGGQKKEYLEKLKSLNEEILSWLTSEIKKNPYCVLTPVFEDYKRHLADIQQDKTEKKAVEKQEEKKKEQEEEKEESVTPEQPFFSMFPTTTPFAKKDDAKPSFSFGVRSQPVPEKTKPKDDEKDQDSDEDTPPKVEVVEVKEDNCVHQIRCKLFYKKDKAFQDKGVGTLYIKQNQGKSQLLVRADTSLGTILLNISLTQGLPIQKSGKNNIMIVCIPNPPIDPKADPVPTPMLIRVKTEADADELLSKLNEITT